MTRHAVVIGAAGAIGHACSVALQSDGWLVTSLDLHAPPEHFGHTGAMDVTDLHSVTAALNAAEVQSPIGALVYAAGVNASGPIDATNWESYDLLLDVNLRGAFHVGSVIQGMLRKNSRPLGMAFLSSTAGLIGEAGGSIYCATKFGLRGFVQSFAAEVAPFGGRANSVCPGNVDSPMLRGLADQIAERNSTTAADVLAELAGTCAFDRLLSPAEVAQTCAWLVSTKASGISGQTIVVDGPPPAG